MEKEFVPPKESLELKEIGFDEPCFTVHEKNNITLWSGTYQNHLDWKDVISAQTYSQAFRWFREKYKLSGVPTHQSYDIYNMETGECIVEVYPLKSYEEAELACLRKLIEIVKNATKE